MYFLAQANTLSPIRGPYRSGVSLKRPVMTDLSVTPQDDAEGRLARVSARESLSRDFSSSLVSTAGSMAIVVTHWGVVPDERLLTWAALWAATLILRLVVAKNSLSRVDRVADPMALVNVQAGLIFFNGVVWGSMMWFLYGGPDDNLFYVRLLVLGSGFAFATGTLSVFFRTYFAFASGIVVPANIIMLAQGLDRQKGGIIVGGMICLAAMMKVVVGNSRRFKAAVLADIEKDRATLALVKANRELTEALERIHTLEGILPICSVCKAVRDENGSWRPIEVYIGERSKAAFSHSYCPTCLEELHPQIYEQLRAEGKI